MFSDLIIIIKHFNKLEFTKILAIRSTLVLGCKFLYSYIDLACFELDYIFKYALCMYIS